MVLNKRAPGPNRVSIASSRRGQVAAARQKHGFEPALLIEAVAFKHGNKTHVVAGPTNGIFDRRFFEAIMHPRLQTDSPMLLVGKKGGEFHLVHGGKLIKVASITLLSHNGTKNYYVASEEIPYGTSYNASLATLQTFVRGMPAAFATEHKLSSGGIDACVDALKKRFGVKA